MCAYLDKLRRREKENCSGLLAEAFFNSHGTAAAAAAVGFSFCFIIRLQQGRLWKKRDSWLDVWQRRKKELKVSSAHKLYSFVRLSSLPPVSLPNRPFFLRSFVRSQFASCAE